jgi:hypothetical protein
MALYGAQQRQKVAGEKPTMLRMVLTLSKSFVQPACYNSQSDIDLIVWHGSNNKQMVQPQRTR